MTTYNFENLTSETITSVRSEVLAVLERNLYLETLRLGESPETYDYATLVVPEDGSTDPLALAKATIRQTLDSIDFIKSL